MGFDLFSIAKEQELNLCIDKSYMLFVLQGEITVNVFSLIDCVVNKEKMLLIPVSSELFIKGRENTLLLMLPFDLENLFSAGYIKRLLSIQTSETTGCLYVKERIYIFLLSVYNFIKDGVQMDDLSEVLEKELFMLLKSYYKEHEIASLFKFVLGKDIAFKQLVIKHCLQVMSLEQLAVLTNYSKSGFIQKFQRCFGEPPHQWILHYKAKRILQDLLFSTKQFQEIADYYMFASYSYFYTFCKKYYGLSPNMIRKRGEKGENMKINEIKCNILKDNSFFL